MSSILEGQPLHNELFKSFKYFSVSWLRLFLDYTISRTQYLLLSLHYNALGNYEIN